MTQPQCSVGTMVQIQFRPLAETVIVSETKSQVYGLSCSQ